MQNQVLSNISHDPIIHRKLSKMILESIKNYNWGSLQLLIKPSLI